MSRALAGCVVVLVGCLPLFPREGAALPLNGVRDDRQTLQLPNQMTDENAGHSTVYRIRGKRKMSCCDLDLFCVSSCPTKRSHPSVASAFEPAGAAGQVSRRSLADSAYKIVDVNMEQYLHIARRAVQDRIQVLTQSKDNLDSRNSK